MKIKACIFDLDGVIVDTAKYHYIAWRKIANELGFEFTEQDNERLKGVSRMRSLEILLEIDAGVGALGHEVGKHLREIGKILDIGPIAALFREHDHQLCRAD